MKNNGRLELGSSLFHFFLNSPPLTRCEQEMSDEPLATTQAKSSKNI